MFDTLYSQIGAVLIVLVVGFAFWKGEEPERIAAGAYGFGWIASLIVQDDSAQYNTLLSVALIDLIMLIVLCALIWKARRNWLVWAAALQLLILATHVLTLVDLRPSIAAYIFVINLAGLGVLLSIAVGTFWVWQERRAAGLE
jgi:hypothetical protein